jgi:hypothetical protein
MEPMSSGARPTGETQINAAKNMLLMALQQGAAGHPTDMLGNTLMMLAQRGMLPAVMQNLSTTRPHIYQALKLTPVMQAIIGQQGQAAPGGNQMEEMIQSMPQELITRNRRTGQPKVMVQGFPRNPSDVGVE